MIVSILQTEFGFKATTHECAEIKGEVVFVCQQVGDFAIASDSMQ